jgi:hypothetical protein
MPAKYVRSRDRRAHQISRYNRRGLRNPANWLRSAILTGSSMSSALAMTLRPIALSRSARCLSSHSSAKGSRREPLAATQLPKPEKTPLRATGANSNPGRASWLNDILSSRREIRGSREVAVNGKRLAICSTLREYSEAVSIGRMAVIKGARHEYCRGTQTPRKRDSAQCARAHRRTPRRRGGNRCSEDRDTSGVHEDTCRGEARVQF